MTAETHGIDLAPLVVLLAAGVIAVALFKRIGLGSVLGYLIAGLLIGPHGLGLFSDAGYVLHIAELGIVMFLFVIGLEMQPSRLWSMREEIFGLGAAQVVACSVLLGGVGVLAGLPPTVAFIGAMGFVLSSTAIVAQVLQERGDTATPRGQRVISILLLEDLAIVPLLALVALLGTASGGAQASHWGDVGIGVAVLVGLIAAGRWLLNPMFRLLALANAREVMTAAALLVVLGAALAMQVAGLSMALGAFLAGVLLSESTFRHQLEADVEPFRSLLLGLFFLGVGMSLDLSLVLTQFRLIVLGVLVCMLTKATGIYLVARLTRATHHEGIYRAALLAQGGEFAFVLYAAAAAVGLFPARITATLTAIVILSMALTPLAVLALRLLPRAEQSLDGVDSPDGLHGRVLIIGFGRFGQVMSQGLLARGVDVAIIDTDIEMIKSAADFGFKVYYGDGTRLDVLHACGAGECEGILVCVDDKAAADKIVAVCKAEFPLVRLFVRAYDRQHSLKLIAAGVDYQIRETFESALAFSEVTLVALGVDPDEARETVLEVRRRDAERLELEVAGGIGAGKNLLLGNVPKPTPFTQPTRESQALNDEARTLVGKTPAASQ
jgi:glutathione-regulated potassium-efflux system protein KefB